MQQIDYSVLLLATVVSSIVAAVIGGINLFFAKKRMVSDILHLFRFHRANDIRNVVGEFFDSYIEEAELEPADRKKLQKALLRAEICFEYYQRGHGNYIKLKNILHAYRDSTKVKTDHTELIEATQKIADLIISRAKYEVGVSPRRDERIRKKIKKEQGRLVEEEPFSSKFWGIK